MDMATKRASCHFDRSEAQHHGVEKSGLELKSQSNCRPDFSTTLRSGRNDKGSAVLRSPMTKGQVGLRCRETHTLLTEKWAFVPSTHRPRSGRKLTLTWRSLRAPDRILRIHAEGDGPTMSLRRNRRRLWQSQLSR